MNYACLAHQVQIIREVVRPPNQLALTEKELDDDLGRVLVATNPANAANKPVRYHLQEHTWKAEPASDPVGLQPPPG